MLDCRVLSPAVAEIMRRFEAEQAGQGSRAAWSVSGP